jgi:hypothetical protein
MELLAAEPDHAVEHDEVHSRQFVQPRCRHGGFASGGIGRKAALKLPDSVANVKLSRFANAKSPTVPRPFVLIVPGPGFHQLEGEAPTGPDPLELNSQKFSHR